MTAPIPASDPPARRAATWLADHPHGDISVFVRAGGQTELHLHDHDEHQARLAAIALGLDAGDYRDDRDKIGSWRTWGDVQLIVVWWRTPVPDMRGAA